MPISENALDQVRQFFDERIAADQQTGKSIIGMRLKPSPTKLSLNSSSVLAQILKQSEAEQTDALIAALHLLVQSGTNFVTEKLTGAERVKLMLDAIYDGSGKDFVQAFGSPLKYLNEPGMLFSPSYDGVRTNPAQTREIAQIENVRSQIATLRTQESNDSFRQNRMQQLESQLALLEAERNAKPVISPEEQGRRYMAHEAKRTHLGSLIIALLNKNPTLSEHQLILLMEAAAELTLSARFNSSEASDNIQPPLLKYSLLMKCLDQFLARSQPTESVLHALDQYGRCIAAGHSYDADEPTKEGVKVLTHIRELFERYQFNGVIAEKAVVRTLTRTTYKPLDAEMLSGTLQRILQSLAEQKISHRAIYFGLVDREADNLRRCLEHFPQLSQFATIFVPPMGEPLNVLSNIPRLLSEHYKIVSPPFSNASACTHQVDVDTLISLLDASRRDGFSFYWSTVVVWDLRRSSEYSSGEAEAEIAEPHSFASCIVLKTDILPAGAPPACKFVSAEIVDGSGLSLTNLGQETARETGIEFD